MKIQSAQETKTASADMLPLLFEIGVEEIPSNVLPQTLTALPEVTKKCFTQAALAFSELQVFGTPRRMTLYCAALAASQETRTEIVVGPPKRAAFAADGKPTKAATGFAKSQHLPLSEMRLEDAATLGAAAKGKKGEYLVLRKIKIGESTAKLLETLLPQIIGSLSFPRSMRWNASGTAFVRPIRSILALYGNRVIPFSFAGVSSSSRTRGHPLMAPETFSVAGFENYQSELARRFVIIDPEERVRVITSQMEALAKEKQAELDLSDEALLWQAAYSVEYPKTICGNFDQMFLKIPKEIIITAMAEHQGYFPLYGKNGELLRHFITILNIDAEDLSLIQTGNERVLRARLHDARFYFNQDRKRPLSARNEDLKQVMFQEKLGSVFEKVERIKTLSIFIAHKLKWDSNAISDLERAAHLCKNDLVTGVVREFTSLQGTMGRVYAALDGEEPSVAKAIEEHYLPKHAGDILPKTQIGQVLAIADKLDTIVGCFGVGLIPTGSEDPYALRRQGLGTIQILVENASFYDFSLENLIKKAVQHYESHGTFYVPDLSDRITAFFKLRIDSYLQHSREIRYDLREAALATKLNKPRIIVECAEALSAFSKEAVFGALITVYKRVARILPDGFEGEVDEAAFIHASEKNLYMKYAAVHEAIAHLLSRRSYAEALTQLSTLNDPLNQFFDDVMVMDKNEAVRKNRLSLLYAVSRPFSGFGDFSKIVEE